MALHLFKLVLFVGLMHLLSGSLIACSYADGALFPTEYDLIKDSEAIVLAQPVKKNGDVVDFIILEVLKGEFPTKQFRGSEVHTSCTEFSFEIELRRSLPPVLAQKLPKRYPKYLLFLKKWKGEWTLSINATEAMNTMIVDVDSSDFLRTLRHLIRVDSKNDYEAEKRELTRLRRLARSGRDPKQYPKELIDWVDRHLNTAGPKKSYRDLIDLYSRLPKEDEKRRVLWAFAWGGHPEAAGFFVEMLERTIPVGSIGPISQYTIQTKNELLLVRLGRNYPELDKGVRWPIMWALIKTADGKYRDLMLAALRSADREEAGRLAEWFVRYPDDEAKEIVGKLVGKDFQENWEITFQLAGMGDIGVIHWAREFMNSPHKDRWMAYYTIAHSPLEEADRLAREVIEKGKADDLVSLIQGFKESQNPNRLDRLSDVVNLRHQDPNILYWLKTILEDLADKGGGKAAELLKGLKE